jgi:riboflavin biosynthesis pyrimidine reductase
VPPYGVWRSVRAGSDTKTERYRRTLGLPQSAIVALREQRRRQAAARFAAGELWQDHGLVFTSSTGKPLDDANVRRGFRGLCQKAGIGGTGETLDFAAMLDDLGARGIGRLMVEGGGVHTQFLAAGLADEIQLAVAPFLIGDPSAPRFVNPAAFPNGPGRRMVPAEVRAVGDVVVLRYLPAKQAAGDAEGAAGRTAA